MLKKKRCVGKAIILSFLLLYGLGNVVGQIDLGKEELTPAKTATPKETIPESSSSRPLYVIISKVLSSDKISEGDEIKIRITIKNDEEDVLDGQIIDIFPKFARVIGAQVDTGFVPRLMIDAVIPAGETKTFEYKLQFTKIPIPLDEKTGPIGSAIFKTIDGVAESNSPIITYSLKNKPDGCNYNFECEPDRGENAKNCMQDCRSDQPDKLCDKSANGVCDPDCAKGADPDCVDTIVKTTTTQRTQQTQPTQPKSVCGDNVCNNDESIDNCPVDCEALVDDTTDYTLIIGIIVVVLAILGIIIYKKSQGDYI